MKNIATVTLSLLILVSGILAPGSTAEELPGVTSRSNNVFLVENHSTAFLILHEAGIRKGTLVHFDAHDDCRYIAPAKLLYISKMLADRDYKSLFSCSDESLIQEYSLTKQRTLYDIGNFIYPCLIDGTITNFIWIVPDKSMSPELSKFLQAHLAGVLRLKQLDGLLERDNGFSFRFAGCQVEVTTLGSMRRIAGETILSLDADFFSLPHALTEEHITGGITYPVTDICNWISTNLPGRKLSIISSSVQGGYLPMSLRFIPDACFSTLSGGTYPEYADTLIGAFISLQTNANVRLSTMPKEAPLLPAYYYLSGSGKLMTGKIDEALPLYRMASNLNPVYAGGILDAAEFLIQIGSPRDADAMIAEFDRCTKKPSLRRDYLKARILLAAGRFDEAQAIAGKMLAHDRSSLALLTSAAILVAKSKYDEAAALYEEVLVEWPGNSIACYDLGFVLQKKDQTDKAIEYYRRAIAYDPKLACAHANLADLFLAQGKIDEAIKHLSEASSIAPLQPSYLESIAKAWKMKGDDSRSRYFLEKAKNLHVSEKDREASR